MIAFRVYVGGKQICTAGVENGFMSTTVQWIGRTHLPDQQPNQLSLHVGGLGSDTKEHLEWLVPNLQVGDRVTIQVVEANKPDEPKRRYKSEKKNFRLRDLKEREKLLIVSDQASPIRIGFRVFANGKEVCSAGAPENGALTVHLMNGIGRKQFTIRFGIGGIDRNADLRLEYPAPQIQVGDRVTVHVFQMDKVDSP
ncbi:MAG TPA: hypothetical protein VGZ25_06925 [Gemmataceae bacterium]|jgi:hypothetical protein|nr:hypothetical protein [Gemmataceae bacterium]